MTVRFWLTRLGGCVLTIALAVVLSLTIAVALPGDPARVLVGPQASAADVDTARRVYALDGTAGERLTRHLTRLVHRETTADDTHTSCKELVSSWHFDMGYSFVYRRPVADVVWARLPRSLELALAAVLLQLLFGVGTGVWAAHGRGRRLDDAAMGAALLGAAMPTFVLGAALQHLLAVRLRWLPVDGVGRTTAEHLASLVLPALVLGLWGAGLVARVTRDEVRAAIDARPAMTARAKGAGPLRVLLVHGLRNALVPIATLSMLELGALVGGAIVTERLFRWPGLGDLAITGVLHRDASLVAGVTVAAATAVALSSLLIDVLAAWLDPRLASSAAGSTRQG